MQKQSWSEILIPNIEKSILKKFYLKSGAHIYNVYRQKFFFETELELEVLNFWNWNGTVKAGLWNGTGTLELLNEVRNWNWKF